MTDGSRSERKAEPPETASSETVGGARLVTGLYVALVALTGVFGYVIGLIRPEALDPELFVLFDLPPTPFGMAVYGMVTVGVVLGALLGLVRIVGGRYDSNAR